MKSAIAPLAAALLLSAVTITTFANQQTEALADLGKNAFPKWLNNPTLVEQVKAQNARSRSLSESEIIALDKKWRSETNVSSQPLIQGVLGNPLSAFLSQIKEDSQGLYTEIFVMDDRGLNVGQSDVTSDYWQGDEAKWQETYPVGPTAVHISEVELDESTPSYQSQVSLSITDPATGETIGAATIGINVELLN